MNSFLDYLIKVVEFHFSETPDWVLRKQFLIEQCLNLTEYWFDMYEEETSPLEDITRFSPDFYLPLVSNLVDPGASEPHNYTCDLNDENQQLFKEWVGADPQILENYTQLANEYHHNEEDFPEVKEQTVLQRIKLELEKRDFPNNVRSFQIGHSQKAVKCSTLSDNENESNSDCRECEE